MGDFDGGHGHTFSVHLVRLSSTPNMFLVTLTTSQKTLDSLTSYFRFLYFFFEVVSVTKNIYHTLYPSP